MDDLNWTPGTRLVGRVTWLLEPDAGGGVAPPDHVWMVCPVCGRRGTVHESLDAPNVRVVCSGGRPADQVPEAKWAADFMPPHDPAVCERG